jgi:hypothetical protein
LIHQLQFVLIEEHMVAFKKKSRATISKKFHLDTTLTLFE